MVIGTILISRVGNVVVVVVNMMMMIIFIVQNKILLTPFITLTVVIIYLKI